MTYTPILLVTNPMLPPMTHESEFYFETNNRLLFGSDHFTLTCRCNLTGSLLTAFR